MVAEALEVGQDPGVEATGGQAPRPIRGGDGRVEPSPDVALPVGTRCAVEGGQLAVVAVAREGHVDLRELVEHARPGCRGGRPAAAVDLQPQR